jgi:hypothetical protein
MNLLKYAERLRCSLIAAMGGWLAGVLATLPIELHVAWRNTDGQPKLAAESFIFGMVIWATWTLYFVFVGWLVAVVPIVLIFPPAWMRHHRRLLLVTLSLASVVLPGKHFGLYTVFRNVPEFDAHNFFSYSGFGVCCAVVGLLVYLRLTDPEREA